MTVPLVSDQKIAETSSKGNQEKWQDGNIWYKLDQFGYEALAEVFTSQLLEYSNTETDFPFIFVRYRMERLLVHGRKRTGCRTAFQCDVQFLRNRPQIFDFSGQSTALSNHL